MVVEKLSFFESAILNFFFQKKKIFFASFLFKLVTIYGVPRIFRNFDDYPDFQQKYIAIELWNTLYISKEVHALGNFSRSFISESFF